VGRGEKISFWVDNWVENKSLLKIIGMDPSVIPNLDLKVSEFITPTGDWNVRLLKSTLNHHPIIQKIIGIALPIFQREDSIC